jgi:hypothetical protein
MPMVTFDGERLSAGGGAAIDDQSALRIVASEAAEVLVFGLA